MGLMVPGGMPGCDFSLVGTREPNWTLNHSTTFLPQATSHWLPVPPLLQIKLASARWEQWRKTLSIKAIMSVATTADGNCFCSSRLSAQLEA